MVQPIKGPATDQTQIEVVWEALADDDTGGSTIISYNLQWDTDGTETEFLELVGESQSYIQTSYTISQGIEVGGFYSFRVRAKNKWGFGDFSEPVLFDASFKPETPDTEPTTSNSGAMIKIEWTLPFNNGAPITAFEILL